MGLEEGDNLGQTLVTHVFKHTQDTSLEENLCCAKTVFIGVHLQGGQDLVGDLLTINESLWDGVGGQDGVSEMENLVI